MNRKRLNLFISLIVGVAIFGFFLQRVGVYSIGSIFENIKPFYLAIYAVVTTLTFFPTAWRWKVILDAHGKRVPFFDILRYTISGYAVSYVTPASRVGGEPLRAYMLKREHRVDLKTGSSSIIIDKFIELLGTAIFGLMGLYLFLFLPKIPTLFKIILGSLVAFTFFLLFMMYYRTITGRGSFSSLFNFFRLYKIPKFQKFPKVLEAVEKRMEKFFIHHKKEFLLGFLAYATYGVLAILELKLLLLGFGVNASLGTLILAINIIGLAGFIPVPASLGFLEAGQSSLFLLTMSDEGIGFVFSLLLRIRSLIFVTIGFIFVTYFSGRQIEKSYEKSRKQEKVTSRRSKSK